MSVITNQVRSKVVEPYLLYDNSEFTLINFQSIPSSTSKNVVWESSKGENLIVTLDSPSGNFTVRKDCILSISANVEWQAVASGGRTISFSIVGGSHIMSQSDDIGVLFTNIQSISLTRRFRVNDQFRIVVFQTTGADLNLVGSNSDPINFTNMTICVLNAKL
jgi:hypothetical protein